MPKAQECARLKNRQHRGVMDKIKVFQDVLRYHKIEDAKAANVIKTLCDGLTTKQRNALPTSKFALPGERKYLIDTLARARNALSRAGEYETPAMQTKIRTAVYKAFPALKERAQERNAA